MTTEISYGHFGEITPDEREEMMLTRQLGAVAPSPTDQAYMRRLDMGQRNVREQIDSGQIPPDVGQSILGRMQERAAPLMLRAEQVPIYMARLNAIRMQRQMAQQEAMFAQNMAFRARTLESRMHTFDDGENGNFTLVETPDGRPIIVNGRPRRGPAGSSSPVDRETLQRQQQAAIIQRGNLDWARNEIRKFRENNPRATPEEIQTEMERLESTINDINSRFGPPPSQLSASGGAAAAIGGAGPAAEATRPGTAPTPFGGVSAAAEPRSGSPPLPIPPELDEILNWRLGTARTAGMDRTTIETQVPRVRETLTRIQNLRARRPLTPEEVAQFEAAVNEIREMQRIRASRRGYNNAPLAELAR
jgi:hypothetical protein